MKEKPINYVHYKVKNGKLTIRAWGGFLNAGGPMLVAAGPPRKAWEQATEKMLEMYGINEQDIVNFLRKRKQRVGDRWESGRHY